VSIAGNYHYGYNLIGGIVIPYVKRYGCFWKPWTSYGKLTTVMALASPDFASLFFLLAIRDMVTRFSEVIYEAFGVILGKDYVVTESWCWCYRSIFEIMFAIIAWFSRQYIFELLGISSGCVAASWQWKNEKKSTNRWELRRPIQKSAGPYVTRQERTERRIHHFFSSGPRFIEIGFMGLIPIALMRKK